MEFRLPDLGEGIHDAELVEWQTTAGTSVQRGDTLAEVMTDKAVIDLPSPFDGTISELLVEAGTIVAVDTAILTYEPANTDAAAGQSAHPDHGNGHVPETSGTDSRTSSAAAPRASPTFTKQADDFAQQDDDRSIQAAPAVRRLAERLGVDLRNVSGSGPQGRVLIDDMADHLLAAGQPATNAPATDKPDAVTRIPLRGMRRRIAERMVFAKRTIPHYSYMDECDVSRMIQARDALRAATAADGVKITFLPFFVRALAAALQEYPLVNSSLDETRDEIVMHRHVHLGIATATPDGLIVPVLRNADQMSLIECAREISRLSTAARSGRIPPDDLGGSTFTLTSIGGIGGLISTPIINHPEVGILGIGRIVRRPVWDENDSIRAASMVYLSFSFDHRVVDGAIGAEFGNAVMSQLQNAPSWADQERSSGGSDQG